MSTEKSALQCDLTARDRTNLVQHFVAFVKDKGLDVVEAKLLVADKSIQTTGSSHDNVRMSLLAGKDFNILLHRGAAIEDSGLHLGHVLREPIELIADLEGQFAGMGHHKDTGLTGNRLDLLKSRKDENGSLAETRFRLAEDIGAEDSLRNADLLNCEGRAMSEISISATKASDP